jgi:uncharacterized membrane protein YkvA (DUF1232 family)
VAADPDIATEEGSRFILELRAMVDYIVHKFTDDLAIFTAALDTLEQMVAENRETRQQELAPTTSELERKEEVEIAHATALAEIKRRMTRKTPAFVRDFLYQWWTKTLVDAYMKERDGDDSWTHRLGAVDALVWSVSPLKTGEIQQLASMLPTLMRSLLRGMNAIEMPADARHGFFNQLMQAHTASINPQGAGEGQPVPTAADVARVEEAPSTNRACLRRRRRQDDTTFTPRWRPSAAWSSSWTGPAVRAKLSWVSPKQTILLFTSSTSGARKLAPKAFAELLRQQKARVIEVSEALMDRVVHAMMGPESVPAAA